MPQAMLRQEAIPVDSRFSVVADALARLRQQTDAGVTQAGDLIAQSAGSLAGLAGLFEALPKDFDSAELRQACSSIEEIAANAERVAAAIRGERNAIDRLAGSLALVDAPIGELGRTIRTVAILSMNARVVSAGTGISTGLEVFTVDIASLAAQAAETIGSLSQRYAALSSDLHAYLERRNSFELRHATALAGLPARLNFHLAQVDAERAQASRRSLETGRTVRSITRNVEDCVMAMQAGDAFRQRLEHVEAGILHVAADTSFYPACELFGALTQDAMDDFAAEMTAAETSLRTIAGEVIAMAGEARGIWAAGGNGASPINRLECEISPAIALLRQCADERAELDRQTLSFTNQVKDLIEWVDSVLEIEGEMRILSLNASIRCGHLGEQARALNVVALQLRELTGSTVTAAESAVAALRASAAAAAEIGEHQDHQLVARVEAMEGSARDAMDLLVRVEERMAGAVDTLMREGPGLARALTDAARTCQQLREHGQPAEALAGELALLSRVGKDDAGGMHEFLAALRPCYTMAAERQLHDVFAERFQTRAGE